MSEIALSAIHEGVLDLQQTLADRHRAPTNAEVRALHAAQQLEMLGWYEGFICIFDTPDRLFVQRRSGEVGRSKDDPTNPARAGERIRARTRYLARLRSYLEYLRPELVPLLASELPMREVADVLNRRNIRTVSGKEWGANSVTKTAKKMREILGEAPC